MNKLALILAAAIPATLFAFTGCDTGSNVVDCTAGGDADCAGTADTPVCDADTNSCVAAQCDGDDQCQATDAGASAACSSNDDCDAGDACVQGDSGNNHCVTLNDPPGGDCGADFVEASGTDVDGASVVFCADAAVTCEDPGRCSGGQFN